MILEELTVAEDEEQEETEPSEGKHVGYENPWRGLALAVIAQAVKDVRYVIQWPNRADKERGAFPTAHADAVDALGFLHSPRGKQFIEICEMPGMSWKKLLSELDAMMAVWDVGR